MSFDQDKLCDSCEAWLDRAEQAFARALECGAADEMATILSSVTEYLNILENRIP